MKEVKEGQRDISIFRALWKLLAVMVKAAPVLFIVDIVLSVFHGMSWGVETMMQQRFFDRAVGMAGGTVSFWRALLALVGLGLANVICQVLNGICNFMPMVVERRAGARLSAAIHEKIARLEPAVFDDTKRLEDINKAEEGKTHAFWFVENILSIFDFYLPYFLFMGWYLFSLKPILAAAILIVFIPTALAQVIRTKVFSHLEDVSAPQRRKYEYYESCIVDREYFKETRLLGGFFYFKKLYLDTLDCMQRLSYKATMKSNLFELAMRLLAVGGYCGILFLLYDALMKGEVTVGAFAAVFHSVGALYAIMEEVVCGHMGEVAKSAGAIRNFLRFLDLEESTRQGMQSAGWGDIVLENVCFSYPDAPGEAVHNVNLTLKRGETLAVVGENGSGKSTLIRLISGLYTPSSGSVRHNGIETKSLSFASLFARTSAVFQKYQRYQMTLEENITISAVQKGSGEKELNRVCAMAGTDAADPAFPEGYQTMLSREFDGVDLSGGQWQRVAIARGFFRDHDLIILDEPTAAIDPYEETQIYNRFAEISKDRSAVIVTHRLGSVKLADRIAVMKEGELVQLGTHEELIAQEGEYRRLYDAQRQWYGEEQQPAG